MNLYVNDDLSTGTLSKFFMIGDNDDLAEFKDL